MSIVKIDVLIKKVGIKGLKRKSYNDDVKQNLTTILVNIDIVDSLDTCPKYRLYRLDDISGRYIENRRYIANIER